ncbi:AAA family ATPase [Zobellia roscoffensis]|uniref:AAA family ATPase n=1 Tax=Zobellia roscoffensis TaxID=2779508 RepID=UPI00188C50EA|nr:AAA family ATPase [Zobellia roscoffensis]
MYLKLDFSNNPQKEFFNDTGIPIYYIDKKPFFNDKNGTQFIGAFSKLNLFVGTNNSGKSRFLRGLLKLNIHEIQISQTLESIEILLEQAEKWYNKNISRLGNLNNALTDKTSEIHYKLSSLNDSYQSLINNHDNYRDIFELASRHYQTDISTNQTSKSYESAVNIQKNYLKIILRINEEIEFVKKNRSSEKIYLPILRSIKKSSRLSPSVFTGVIEDLYNLKDEKIFTGLDLYDKVLEVRNSVETERRGFEKFEFFLAEHFFNGLKVEIIANYKDKCIIFYVDGEERKIHDIGDGIQSLILLLFPVFTARKNSWIFIEEPETYLHPGLQRIFLETLISNEYLSSQNLKLFFSTHSNHFLDQSLNHEEISIFQFEKEKIDKFNIKTNVKPEKEILDLLGVNTSSVFLANSTIWVEGPTDRKYISKFLKLYCKHYDKAPLKEDIDFAFFEYGGNLIAHYLFVEDNFEADESEIREKIAAFALSNKIFLIADHDNAKGTTKKGKRRIALQTLSDSNSNFCFQSTELREIENLLPTYITSSFIGEIIKDTNKNSLPKVSFNKTEYNQLGLGDFYEKLLIETGINKSEHKTFKAESGTLKNDYKIKLCEFTISADLDYINMIDDNPVLDKIITKLYKFITE